MSTLLKLLKTLTGKDPLSRPIYNKSKSNQNHLKQILQFRLWKEILPNIENFKGFENKTEEHLVPIYKNKHV